MIKASQTQRRAFAGNLNDAIAKDRKQEVSVADDNQTETDAINEPPWQLWLALGVGGFVILIAALL